MGVFQDRLFSLRVVLAETELVAFTSTEASEAASRHVQRLDFRIADVRQSLCFPAVYRDAEGNELVDYSVVYEGVFRVGDVVRATVCVERLTDVTSRPTMRYVIEEVEPLSHLDLQ